MQKCAEGGLTTADAAHVADDYSLGTEKMRQTIIVKTSHWAEFPWRLCRLAHWNSEYARTEASHCFHVCYCCSLQSFISSSSSNSSGSSSSSSSSEAINAIADYDATTQSPMSHHRITWSWMNKHSPIRAELESFSQGAALEELPLLRHRLAEMMLVPTAERRQEADHALIDRYVQTSASGPYISLVLRRPQIESICSSEAGRAQFIKILHAKCRDPKKIARALSLAQHPLWLRGVEEKQPRQKQLQILAHIVYSLDIDAQFLQLSATRKKRQEHAKRTAAAAAGASKKPKALAFLKLIFVYNRCCNFRIQLARKTVCVSCIQGM